MRLLLDTHAAIWFAQGDERLSTVAREAIEAPAGEVLLSAVVIWEIAIKRSLGKLPVNARALDVLLAGGAVPLPITLDHAAAVEALPPHHRDPFDRLLVAQAIVERAVIVTGDENVARYDVEVCW